MHLFYTGELKLTQHRVNVIDISTTYHAETLVFIVQDADAEAIYATYRTLVHALRNYSKVILVDATTEQSDCRLLYMLMIAQGQYNIYQADLDIVDEAYLEKIALLECDLTDTMLYIEKGTEYYHSLLTTLNSLDGALQASDLVTALAILRDNSNFAKYTIHYVNYLSSMIEYLSNKLEGTTATDSTLQAEYEKIKSQLDEIQLMCDNYKEECESYKKEIATLSEKDNEIEILRMELDTVTNTCNLQLSDKVKIIEDLEFQLTELTNKVTEYELSLSEQKESKETDTTKTDEQVNKLQSELDTLKADNEKLMRQLNAKGPTITTYAPIQLTTIKCATKAIIYFKEISYVPYMNTLVMQLMSILDRAKDNNKSRLIIYDNKCDFPIAYSNLTTVTGDTWVDKKQSLLASNETLLVTEHSQSILEDILKTEHGLVIVYDRLKQKRDLVEGDIVRKYWVANSASNIDAIAQILKGSKIQPENIITRPGVMPNTLGLSEIADYRKRSTPARMADWVHLANPNATTKDSFVILDILASVNFKLKPKATT